MKHSSQYTILVFLVFLCLNGRASNPIKNDEHKVKIYEVFTPNNDGMNDFFTIEGLDKYPNSLLQIYNKESILIFSKRNYTNDWDGHPNTNVSKVGSQIHFGSYLCILTIPKVKTIKKAIFIVQ